MCFNFGHLTDRANRIKHLYCTHGMSYDKSPEDNKNGSSIEEAKTKLNTYQEILKIKPKKARPTIDKLKKMMTQKQFEKLNIPS